MRKCERCGAEFKPNRGNQKWCSRDCYNKASNERKQVKPRKEACTECGATFETTSNKRRCSPGCVAQHRQKYHREREQGAHTLFDQPLEFKTLRFKRLPDGFSFIDVADLHIPFQDVPTLACVERFWNDLKPDLEIIAGDAADFYAVSPFDQNPTRMFDLPDEAEAVAGWLQKRANKNPAAKRIFMEGNHEDRVRRWLWRHGKEFAKLRGLQVPELLHLKDSGYEHLTYRSVVDLLGCRIEHGYRASKSAAMPQNVAQLMARATNSSGICHHTHRINEVHWTDARGSHSYRESGCLCRMDLEFAPFPNWQWALSWGVVHKNQLHIQTVPIYPDGMRVEGTFYPRNG